MNGSIPYIYMPNPIYIMLNYLSSTILFFYLLLRIYIILFYKLAQLARLMYIFYYYFIYVMHIIPGIVLLYYILVALV